LGTSEVSVLKTDQRGFCLQVGSGLAGKIGRFSPALRAALQKETEPVDPEVQSAYELGRYSLEERSAPAFKRAVRQFERAIELNSAFAPAHAGLVIAKSMQAQFYFRPPVEVAPLARASAERATVLDPTFSESHLANAFVKYLFDWDWAGAEDAVRRALALDEHSVEALLLYGRLLRSVGRIEEALVHVGKARKKYPLDWRTRISWARMLADAGRLEESIAEHEDILALWPDRKYSLMFMGQSYQQNNRLEEAARIYRDLYREYEENPDPQPGFGDLAFYASVFGQVGDHELAERILEDLLSRREAGEFVASDAIAWVLGGLGRIDEAVDWVYRAHEEGEHGMIHLKSWQCYDPLRADPRFQDLVREVYGDSPET
jgi:tetratricopeptide (TPR) repeat protein